MLMSWVRHPHSGPGDRKIKATTCRQLLKPLLHRNRRVSYRLDRLAEIVGLSAHHIDRSVLDTRMQICGGQRERRLSHAAVTEDENLASRRTERPIDIP